MVTILPYREKEVIIFGYLKALFLMTRWKERNCNRMANFAGGRLLKAVIFNKKIHYVTGLRLGFGMNCWIRAGP